MLYIILFSVSVMIGGYFIFRYVSLVFAIRKITEDICDIQQDVTQNQMLHLPVPNRYLSKLLSAFNGVLCEIRKERWKYEKREREFQKQIENISHDLRTPLTVILGYLKLFGKQDGRVFKQEELNEMISIIEHKAEVMKDLVAQFYDYSRIQAGDYELTLQQVDVCRILRESIMGNYQILSQKDLKVEIEIPDHPVFVLGEEAALERIFFNLFQNAARYADTLFEIGMKEEENRIAILFTNDTRLLLKEDVPHLFERFYMQDASRSKGGTGLGLTVAKSLAEEMQGSLSVYVLENLEAEDVQKMTLCFELCFYL